SPNDPSREHPIQGTVLHHLPAVLLEEGKSLPDARSLAVAAVAMYQRHLDWPLKETSHALEVLRDVLVGLGKLPGKDKDFQSLVVAEKFIFGEAKLSARLAEGRR